MDTRIDALSEGEALFISEYDGNVWLNIVFPAGSARIVLTPEQAREAVAAINKVLEAV